MIEKLFVEALVVLGSVAIFTVPYILKHKKQQTSQLDKRERTTL